MKGNTVTVKAYIYADDGSMVGFIAYMTPPPEVLELGGRFFQRGAAKEETDGDFEVLAFDYHELDVEADLDVIEICVSCGRNSSVSWWKCCPEHVSLDAPDVFCQSCVEWLHPKDPEFERE